MNVIISARHCSPPNSIREEADEQMRRLGRFEPRLSGAEVNFDTDHGENQVEARLIVSGRQTIVAHGSGETFQDALHRTVDRLSRQLKRRRERHRDHQAVKLSRVLSPEAEGI